MNLLNVQIKIFPNVQKFIPFFSLGLGTFRGSLKNRFSPKFSARIISNLLEVISSGVASTRPPVLYAYER